MFSTSMPRRAARALAAAAALTFAAACNDATGPDEDDHGHADEVASLRLTVTPSGGTVATYTVTNLGVAPSPLRLPVGSATVTVDFLDDAGAVISDEIHDDEYEIQFLSLPTGVTFTRSGAFAGTFTATTAGTGTMQTQLFHLDEGHEDVGPWPIAVQIGG